MSDLRFERTCRGTKPVWRPMAEITGARAAVARDTSRQGSPRWACLATYLALLFSFCSNAFTLDRYPFPYVDEPFFYYPAVRALEGKGLNYECRSDVPFGDSVWAYHGPFFPRVLVVSFWLFGENQFACRFPQYLAAHLALLFLCTFMLRKGLFRSSLMLSLVWIGDYSHYRLLFGRMEGICLLLLAGAFVALVQATTRRSFGAALVAGFLLGASVGFHPFTGLFPVGASLLILALARGRRMMSLLCLGAGGLAAAFLILACWLPSPAAAIEQFRWGLRYGAEINTEPFWVVFMSNRIMFKTWFLGLSLTTLLVVGPLALAIARRNDPDAQDNLQRREIFLIAAAFSMSALLAILVLVGAALKTYYIVCFSVWPIVALLVYLESAEPGRKLRLALLGVGVLLCACWLPGLRYNAYHVRESLQNYHLLDEARVAAQLARVIPEGAKVTGSPELFFVARKAGLNFVPLPWYSEAITVPPDKYVLLSEGDWQHPRAPRAYVDPVNLSARQILLQASLAPGTTLPWQNYFVFGPIRAQQNAKR